MYVCFAGYSDEMGKITRMVCLGVCESKDDVDHFFNEFLSDPYELDWYNRNQRECCDYEAETIDSREEDEKTLDEMTEGGGQRWRYELKVCFFYQEIDYLPKSD